MCGIESPMYFAVDPKTDPGGPTHFEVYLLSLWALVEPKERLGSNVWVLAKAAAGKSWNRFQAECVFVFLYAPTVRMEASVLRRLKALNVMTKRDTTGDVYVPGIFPALDDTFSDTVHYPSDQRGPETTVKFAFNSRLGEFDYTGVGRI